VLDLAKSHSALSGHMTTLAVGFVVSFLTAILAIKSFIAYIQRKNFAAFGWYRIALAVVYFFVFVR
jgi:undecaprenyl-diphosphatase